MVHIKRIELTHFKSFGGSAKIPILPGFTVVSGPNGSGKSNILDALLFCLGLASSKGMRADRLPDLVNHKQNANGKAAEATVSVTFNLDDWDELKEDWESGEEENEDNQPQELTQEKPATNQQLIKSKEWTVTRRLRVSRKGSYSSTFYSNGEVCTATEIHEQLEKLRIYPEGYNVVLQGDVTRIISMNSRQRREIIDELAGVGAFDRKIEQAKKTLEKVREREERCQIIEQELISTRDRLAADRVKAEKYRQLKERVQLQKRQEVTLSWLGLVQQKDELLVAIDKGDREITTLTEELAHLSRDIAQYSTNLTQLNSRVKELGEDEQLSLASELATQKAKRSGLQQRQTELQATIQQKESLLAQITINLQQYQRELEDLTDEKNKLDRETVPQLSQQYYQAKNLLDERREIADTIAAASEAWVQEQAQLTREISTLQNNLNPQRTEQATITERLAQIVSKITEETGSLETTETALSENNNKLQSLNNEVTVAQDNVTALAEQLAVAKSDRDIQREIQQRLLLEQRSKQRELDKLEAKKQAQQEAQGTYASKIILNANLPGVHGLVVQLGQVDSQYHLALETAAGGRLGYIVVENDRVGAEGIELLKAQRAGRATFLPLNKIKPPRQDNIATLRFGRGYIDRAVNLVNCEARYRSIFAYVFGNTIVFDTLENARSSLGKHRIVTLEGDILEISGAMSGGSKSARSSLRFGKVAINESREADALRNRLTQIADILTTNDRQIEQLSNSIQKLSESLTETRQFHREKQLRLEQLQKETKQLTLQQEQLTKQLAIHQQERVKIQERSQFLATNLPEREAQLQQLQQKLDELEASHDRSEWQQIQTAIKAQEQNLQQKEIILRQTEDRAKDINNQIARLKEKTTEAQQQTTNIETEQITIGDRQETINEELQQLSQKIVEAQTQLQKLNSQLKEIKSERDRTENQLKELQHRQQKKSWAIEKLGTTQQEKNNNLTSLETQIVERERELSDSSQQKEPTQQEELSSPKSLKDRLYRELFDLKEGEALPVITYAILQEKLEQLQKQIRNGEKRLEAMEPVNMLALVEYEKTEARLQQLSEKLSTIAAERTELLLRVEKFTTLRLRAFKEAYDAVDANFQKIFAELSEGDGHLQLEDTEDPFNGGLMLVAHPKGKPVQRLSSMSGGEKSLTALSFIFSLQKYRPSPFYAFDEVDMFLDGANVEKLSRMVKKQAQEAQFIVVSLRRPMIEASERTIGVTQARGAHTQVLGIKL